MTHQEDINSADAIVRADQFNFFFLRQVSEIEEAEFPVSDQQSQRGRVLCWIVGGSGLSVAGRIGLTGSRKWSSDLPASGGEHLHVESRKWDRISRPRRKMVGARLSEDGFLVFV